MSTEVILIFAGVLLAILAAAVAGAADRKSIGDQTVLVIPERHRRGEAHRTMTLSEVHDSRDLNDGDYVILPSNARNPYGPREVRVREVRSVWDVEDLDATTLGSESRAGPWLTGQNQTEADDEPKPARHSPAAWLGWMFVLFLGAAFLIIRLA